jgi:hypothetical protein
MVITSFSLVSIDVGQQPHKAQQIAGSFDCFRFTHGQSAQIAELRSQVIVRRWC